MERLPRWSEGTAASRGCACRGSMPRDSTPDIPGEKDTLLFRSGVDLKEKWERGMNKRYSCNRDSFSYRGQVVPSGRDHGDQLRFIA